jgi:hypothetical protein
MQAQASTLRVLDELQEEEGGGWEQQDSPFKIIMRVAIRFNSHSAPSNIQPIPLTDLIMLTKTTKQSEEGSEGLEDTTGRAMRGLFEG